MQITKDTIEETKKALAALAKDAREATSDAVAIINQLTSIPTTDEELDALLDELALADIDCSEHFKRYEGEARVPWERQSNACQDDWSRAHARREKSIDALKRVARARHAAKQVNS